MLAAASLLKHCIIETTNDVCLMFIRSSCCFRFQRRNSVCSMRCRWEVGKLLQQQNEAKQHFKLNSRIDIHLNDAV